MTTQEKIALVTGANKGIGYETVRLLAERGMTVLLGARDEERGRTAAESLKDAGDVRFQHIDVTDQASIDQAAKTIGSGFGRLDVLVNNAGIAQGYEPPSQTPLDTMRTVFETNVFGVIAVTNAMFPLLLKAEAARIVNVSSEVGSITSTTKPPLDQFVGIPYPASKTALNMVTAQYAKELKDTKVKINAANPGYCATDLNANSGFRTPTQGAEVSVHLATLDDDGPSGVLWGSLWLAHKETDGILPW